MLSGWSSMKRMGVDCTATAISGKEFRKGGVKIVRNERGDDVLFAIRNDEEMAGTNGIEIVLPSGTWVNAWLGTIGTGSSSFCVSVHCHRF